MRRAWAMTGLAAVCLLIGGNALHAQFTTPVAVLMDRAHAFEKAGLPALARRQMAFVLETHPGHTETERALAALTAREVEERFRSAGVLHRLGAHEAALFHLERALAAAPRDGRLLDLKNRIAAERQSRINFEERVHAEYASGVRFFQSGRLEAALSHFVRVANLDPAHRGALDYIRRIGERMGASER